MVPQHCCNRPRTHEVILFAAQMEIQQQDEFQSILIRVSLCTPQHLPHINHQANSPGSRDQPLNASPPNTTPHLLRRVWNDSSKRERSSQKRSGSSTASSQVIGIGAVIAARIRTSRHIPRPNTGELPQSRNLDVIGGAQSSSNTNDIGVVALTIDVAAATRRRNVGSVPSPDKLDADKVRPEGGERAVRVVEEVDDGWTGGNLEHWALARCTDGLEVGCESLSSDAVEEDCTLEVWVALDD